MSGYKKAPVVLFVYNRPEHTQKTIEALQKNIGADQTPLYIYSDGPRDEKAKEMVAKTRAYLHTVTGFASIEIVEREENMGLARSVIAGTTDVVSRYGRVIVMEDDLVTGRYFLDYMNQALERYQDEKKVFSITGFSHFPKGTGKLPESYFLKVFSSWSWATWKDRWELFDADAAGWEEVKTNEQLSLDFDYDGCFYNTQMLLSQMEYHTIDSWAIRAYWTQYRNDMVTLFPNRRLVENVGCDGSGVHCNTEGDYIRGILSEQEITKYPATAAELPESKRELKRAIAQKKRAYKRFRMRYYLKHPIEAVHKIKEKSGI
jgi:hypothetical protein